MINYEVTLYVDERLGDRWEAWMRETHIPKVMKTNCFRDHRFARSPDRTESGQRIYLVIYEVDDRQTFDWYEKNYAEELRGEMHEEFPTGITAERRLVEDASDA